MIALTLVVIDSSAWIEYLYQFDKYKLAQKVIEDEKNTLVTPGIVAGEVISKTTRQGLNASIAEDAIKNLSISASETQDDYFEAGKKHALLRKKDKSVSLADAIILTIAERMNAKILTKDSHLKDPRTIML